MSMNQAEKDIRTQLAACYRIFDHMGWSEIIYNHITVKIPNSDGHFLINPYGLHYKEVTASNLVKVDINGKLGRLASGGFRICGYAAFG